MSVSKDNDQKKFRRLSTNVYQIGIKGKSPSVAAKVSSYVLKAGDLNSNTGPLGSVRVDKYIPSEITGKRVTRPSSLPAASSPAPSSVSTAALESMKQNLKDLNNLQARLRFVLKELEELVQE